MGSEDRDRTIRSSGQTSSSSRTTGTVTSIGLAINPSARAASTSAIRRQLGARVQWRCASSVRKKNVPDRTSLRSLAQATDSTRRGCTAKSSATTKAAHGARVACASHTRHRTAFSA
jgi:hypothetical protein